MLKPVGSMACFWMTFAARSCLATRPHPVAQPLMAWIRYVRTVSIDYIVVTSAAKKPRPLGRIIINITSQIKLQHHAPNFFRVELCVVLGHTLRNGSIPGLRQSARLQMWLTELNLQGIGWFSLQHLQNLLVVFWGLLGIELLG